MARTVRVFLPVTGDREGLATAFDDDPIRWLPAAKPDGPRRYVLTLRAGSLHREVRASIGSPWRAGETHGRALSWEPINDEGGSGLVERFLPSLDGELGLHLAGTDHSTLVLDARYRPPGGHLGEALDASMLRRVSRATVERFLEDITPRLAAEGLLRAPARPPRVVPIA